MKQTYEQRLREVSLATIDAKLRGCGFLMILPDNSFQHVPHDLIEIKPEVPDEGATRGVDDDPG